MRGNKSGKIAKKAQERRLKWQGQVMRKEEHYFGRMAMEMKLRGRRKGEMSNRRMLDRVRNDIKDKALSGE